MLPSHSAGPGDPDAPAGPADSATPHGPGDRAAQGARPVRVAQLGCGTVGTQVARLLLAHSAEIAARVGARVELRGIGVRDASAPRDESIPPELFTTDLDALVAGADVVVELMGGTTRARELTTAALASGASVVTANKALLATHGPELYEAADAAGVDLLYEAAVAGAVPVVRGVRESLAGDRVQRVLGILNGTTNFILDRMTSDGLTMADALAKAQELGYAEADPTADVEGHDAAAKAAILASLAFHTRVALADVTCEGITRVSADDVAAVAQTGGVIKLLAIAERVPGEGGDCVAVRVHPAVLPATHPLAVVAGAYNAVVVEAEAAGRLMFYGAGAGGAPTASAVLGDLVAAARHRTHTGRAPAESAYAHLPLARAEQVRTRMQIHLEVKDQPGVLADLASAVATHGVSIEAVRQAASREGTARLTIVTHTSDEASLHGTVEELARVPGVVELLSAYRVEQP